VVEPLFVKLRKEELVFTGECFVELKDVSQVELCVKDIALVRFRGEALPELKIMPMKEWMAQFKVGLYLISCGLFK
jgi:hypothetical protein